MENGHFKLVPSGFGAIDYQSLVQEFNPTETADQLRARLGAALEVVVGPENIETEFMKPEHIFDFDAWRFYIHKSVIAGDETAPPIICALAYNARFEAFPLPLQLASVIGCLMAIIGQEFPFDVIQVKPGHVALELKLEGII